MFAKPYKLKSNNSLKNTEKKNLVQRIHDEFPKADLEKLKELVPNKSVATCMKLMVYSGQMVLVYVVDGVPVMIELESGLVPTVYALWKVPEMIPAITIHSPVLPKVVGGAPLYVPGVVIPTGGVGFPLFASGSLVAARTQDNSTAAVVGRAQMSSADMLLKNIGVCLEIIHVFGDQLCKDSKLARVERPCGTSAAYARAEPAALAEEMGKMSLQPPRDEWPTLGAPPPAEQPPPFAAPARNAPALIPDAMQAGDNVDCEEEEENEDGDEDVPSNMDELLQWSLLTFLKLDAKNVTLPLKTNLLYKNYLIPLCPEDRTLDVKKSSYKKMSKFLEAMQKDGLVEVREIEKGVSALTALNTTHTLVRGLSVPPRVRDHRRAAPAAPDYAPPRVRDLYCLTARVAPLVPHLKKGTGLTAAEVRAILTEHVRTKQLQGSQKQTVTLDTVLAAVTGNKEHESMKWEALTSTVLGRMTAATELRFEDGEVRLIKAKLEPIKMQVATRSGNKKVTLVSNLEAYGFRLPALSHACQLAVGAACGVTRSPGAKNDQLMLQGDQTHFVAKLLIEKYGLPKKFVEGADKALNKKK